MMRQLAFAGAQRLLKGALHCHTTRSDGDGDPLEVIRLHETNGYDFMALTDHNIYNHARYARDTHITILPGVERDHILPGAGRRSYHTVLLGPLREKGNGYAPEERFQRAVPVADQHAFQPIVDDYLAHNNIVILCHPEWSGISARDFNRVSGFFAMEIWNSGSAIECDLDRNAAYWDELLLGGSRVYGVAVDDGHDMAHHCKGWVCVRADNDENSILRALQQGAFYSSCGPEITDFYVENDRAVLTCTPCASAGFRSDGMPTRLSHSQANDIVRVEYEIPSNRVYVRGVVKDASGRRAWTNPIFL